MEHKALQTFTKGINGRTVEGFAAIFGNVDSGGDIVHKGAFKKTLQENRKRFRHLWMHNPFEVPTATIKDIAEVGKGDLPNEVKSEYPEATGGLYVAREYLETPRGDEILTAIKAGAINEMSFGFDIVKFDFGTIEDRPVRNLKELMLYDTSDVTWGMNAATVASKTQQDTELQMINTWIQSLQDNVKAGRVLSSANLQKLKDALAVLNDILLSAEPSMDEESMKSLTEGILKRLAIAELQLNYS
jgi:HK97 family phage prohead protease